MSKVSLTLAWNCAPHHEELVVSVGDAARALERLGHLLDEPLADMSFVPLHLLLLAAKGTVTVALTGDGGLLVDAHLREQHDHRKALWSLLAFELWRTEYLGEATAA